MKAVIFDMDGLLIDSEPFWTKAEKMVFSSVGVELSDSLCEKTASMTTREVTEFWHELFPWNHKSIEAVENEVIDCVDELIKKDGQPMVGAKQILGYFHERNYRIGLSTNSPFRLIATVLNKLNIAPYFHGVSSSEHVERGKPDPAVYFSTLKKLEIDAERCIAFEDSPSGVMAAKAAGIKTVVVPPAHDFDNPRYSLADVKLRTLLDYPGGHARAY
ncbi:HAD family hydrolase [Marinobacter guineae]|uniref:HAD family hydrolase n=1 Tax=Marinobacter guineae TaxID=432303 RepID=A0A2G1VI50_9GAMM|nr:hexitol phosphatase HxpB [Marinobacter guineae]PHQ26428.1 HAD family hydrolase [Marinobacter guineae]